MTINKMAIKFLGKKGIIFRVLDKNGEVLQVFTDLAEANEYIKANA